VMFRYQQKLTSVSQDALNHAMLLARLIVNASRDYLTAEVVPALLTCVIGELAAEPDSFPASASGWQHAKISGDPVSVEAQRFGKTCTEPELLKLLVIVRDEMSERAPELALANSAALTRSIERTLQTEDGNNERVAALFTDIFAFIKREA